MEVIKIGDVTYSRTKIKNNIIKTYNKKTESELNDWYQEAHDFGIEVSEMFKGVSKRQVLGIISALSPLKEWNKNKELAVDLILTGNAGHMKRNVQKARDILALKGSGIYCNHDEFLSYNDSMVLDFKIREILNGEKTKAFYTNMAYPKGKGVTVDRHAIAIAIGRTATNKEQAISKDVYTFIEKCYIMTSETLGLAPLHLQSITWQTWKRVKAG
jgi:ribosomal protein S9